MPNIEIDDAVYSLLEGKGQGFGDTANFVLRRLLGLPPTGEGAPQATAAPLRPVSSTGRPYIARTQRRGKAPKADLRILIAEGALKEGQVLYFRDYQGNAIEGVQATIRGNELEYEGRLRAMSPLAREVMQERGYASDDYRGPQFWFTADGHSVRELWDAHLKKTHQDR